MTDNKSCASFNAQHGMTLIEIIITIVITGILASMLYSYFGTAVTRSVEPLIRLGSALDIEMVMENITSDYKSLYNASTKQFDLGALKVRVRNQEPEVGPPNINYGPSPVVYTVVENHFIKFTAYNEDTYLPGNNLLKVTVKNTATGETLTVLFSKS